ncbi:transposable element Tcb2 transposase [Trichonephila clavipes]|nr:transposable element Tcb2 transposase [Trichonephila clavipes]
MVYEGRAEVDVQKTMTPSTDHRLVRNARVQPTASSASVQAQVAPPLGAPGSRRTVRRRPAEGHLGLRVLPLAPLTTKLGPEWNQVVPSGESRFHLGSDDHCVCEWSPRGEGLNPAFAPAARVMVWGAIAYDTRSPLVLIHDIVRPHVLPLMQGLPITSSIL